MGQDSCSALVYNEEEIQTSPPSAQIFLRIADKLENLQQVSQYIIHATELLTRAFMNTEKKVT